MLCWWALDCSECLITAYRLRHSFKINKAFVRVCSAFRTTRQEGLIRHAHKMTHWAVMLYWKYRSDMQICVGFAGPLLTCSGTFILMDASAPQLTFQLIMFSDFCYTVLVTNILQMQIRLNKCAVCSMTWMSAFFCLSLSLLLLDSVKVIQSPLEYNLFKKTRE